MRRLPFDQRRRELIEAAVRVIARDGLAAASTRAITSEAGMPVGAFHYVFTSRDDLIRALIGEVADAERTAVLAELHARGDATLEELIAAGFEAYLRLLEADPDGELAVVELALHGARHDRSLVVEQWEGYVGVAAETLARAGELCGQAWRVPLREVARSLISALDGLTLTWLTTRDSDAARRHIAFLAHAFAALADPSEH